MINTASYRKILEGRRSELIQRRTETGNHFHSNSLLEMFQQVEDHELRRLEEAIDRCRNGTYGKCTDCSKDISDNRLKLMPETKHCFNCGTRNFQPWLA